MLIEIFIKVQDGWYKWQHPLASHILIAVTDPAHEYIQHSKNAINLFEVFVICDQACENRHKLHFSVLEKNILYSVI